MVIWCAYCQRFVGERPPFDENMISHGMCDTCAALDRDTLTDRAVSIQPVAQLMRDLWQFGLEGGIEQMPEVLARARALHIRPSDLLVGLVSPLLVTLGRHWQEGTISIADEHRFTAFYEAVIWQLRTHDETLRRFVDADPPQMLLVACDSNYHTVGLRMAELWLAEQGIRSRTILPGLPAGEVVSLVERWAPPMVGISLSLPEQVPAVQEVVRRLERIATRSRMCVGGYVVKTGRVVEADLPGVLLVPHLLDLAPHLRQALQAAR